MGIKDTRKMKKEFESMIKTIMSGNGAKCTDSNHEECSDESIDEDINVESSEEREMYEEDTDSEDRTSESEEREMISANNKAAFESFIRNGGRLIVNGGRYTHREKCDDGYEHYNCNDECDNDDNECSDSNSGDKDKEEVKTTLSKLRVGNRQNSNEDTKNILKPKSRKKTIRRCKNFDD